MKNYLEQIKQLWAGMPRNRRLATAGLLVTALAGLIWFVANRGPGDFRPIYTDLTEEDAGKIVEKLKTLEVAYRLEQKKDGVSILVPSANLAEARLSLASGGLPSSGRMGFEIFDQSDFAATEFTEQIKYARALEGELERSIQLIESIDKARVHITFAKDSVFLEARRPAKASVMIKLKDGRHVGAQNVMAIKMLIARAVQGLEADSVSLLDMDGNLLEEARKDPERERDEASLAYRRQIEQNLLTKIRGTLDPLLGPDHYTAGVTVECDLATTEQSEEIFNPDQSVISTSQKTEETSDKRLPGGVPGTATNLPRPTATPNTGAMEITRRTENVTYQSSRSVKKQQIPQGNVQRISVGLVFDQRVQFATPGDARSATLVPTPEDKVNSIRDLVSAVVGVNSQRGDQITVQSMAFEETLNRIPPPRSTVKKAPPTDQPVPPINWQKMVPGWFAKFIQNLRDNPQMLLIVGAIATGLLLLIGVGVYLLIGRRKKKAAQIEMQAALKEKKPAGAITGESGEEESALSSAQQEMKRRIEARNAQKDQLTAEELRKLKLSPTTTKQSEVLLMHLREVVESDPEFAAHALLTWVAED